MASIAGIAFIPYYKQLMEILETNDALKRTSKGILTQMAYPAGGAGLGGFVLGPPGALIGGFVGLVVGYMKVDNYDSMVSVLKNLSDKDKKKLVKKVQELVGSSSIEALTAFIRSQVQTELLINTLQQFTSKTKGG